MTMSTASITASPARRSPVATSRTSSGRPDSRIPSASSKEVSGVRLEGLSSTALPAASAGMQSPKELISG